MSKWIAFNDLKIINKQTNLIEIATLNRND